MITGGCYCVPSLKFVLYHPASYLGLERLWIYVYMHVCVCVCVLMLCQKRDYSVKQSSIQHVISREKTCQILTTQLGCKILEYNPLINCKPMTENINMGLQPSILLSYFSVKQKDVDFLFSIVFQVLIDEILGDILI